MKYADLRASLQSQAQDAVSLANEIAAEEGQHLTRSEWDQILQDYSDDERNDAWAIYLAITERPS